MSFDCLEHKREVYQGQVELRSALPRALSASLVNSKSGLDHSLTVLLQERSHKKTAALNENKSVLAAILSDIFDHSDTNFIQILS